MFIFVYNHRRGILHTINCDQLVRFDEEYNDGYYEIVAYTVDGIGIPLVGYDSADKVYQAMKELTLLVNATQEEEKRGGKKCKLRGTGNGLLPSDYLSEVRIV